MERFRPFDFQPRGPRLPYVESILPLRRLLDPFLINCEASPFLYQTTTPHLRTSAPSTSPLASFAIRNRGFSKIAAERGAS